MRKQFLRAVGPLSAEYNKHFSFSFKPSEWKNALSEAEKIVGYSTSFLSLRCLLSDELSNVATHMKKLVGTSHPLLKTAQKLFQDGKQSTQTRGLMVLLISKAAGPSSACSMLETMVSGIYSSQRTLAEITELIHTSSLIHKSVVNLQNYNKSKSNGSSEDMEFGNKMAVLSGDFLLANASKNLASLENTKVVEMISTAIRDLMKSEFTQFRDMDGKGVLPLESIMNGSPPSIEQWEEQTFLSSGSLLAYSCQAALTLAQHDQKLQQSAFEFGRLMALAHQFKEELTMLNDPLEPECFDLSSAPILIYLNKQGDQLQYYSELQNAPSKEVSRIILEDKSVIKECKDLCKEYGKKAIESLSLFKQSDAKSVLINMVNAVTKV